MVKHPALLFFPLYFTIIWFFSQLFDGRKSLTARLIFYFLAQSLIYFLPPLTAAKNKRREAKNKRQTKQIKKKTPL